MPVAFVAHPDFKNELKAELGSGFRQFDRLFVSDMDFNHSPAWAQDCWPELRSIEFKNETDLLSRLHKLHSRWVELPLHKNKQIKIRSDLHYQTPKTTQFLQKLPNEKFAVFAIVQPRKAIVCLKPEAPFPFGEVNFSEDRKPPNRAYLKLWELMSLYGVEPKAGDFCLDLGASPGGWTWVLQTMGCQILAIDKAPLDPFVAKLNGVSFRRGDAFQINLDEFSQVDWIFSDVICYPERLLEYISIWMKNEKVKNIVCTVKLKGEPDVKLWQKFQSIPDSQTRHLWHNKHELTWFWRRT